MIHPKQLVLASANPGKIKELQELLADQGISIVPQGDLNIPDIEETGLTFVENAILKARNAAALSGLPAIADDSGLEVDYLLGAPGIYSARYAGIGATDATNREKLLAALVEVPTESRNARYQTVIVYLRHAEDPTPIICQGTWEGRIALEHKGSEGFGYDPIFIPQGKRITFGEMKASQKFKIDHRYEAFKKIKKFF